MEMVKAFQSGPDNGYHTWGKQTGIPPRIAFGGLKIACKRLSKFIGNQGCNTAVIQPN
jgi:hypothetical protein